MRGLTERDQLEILRSSSADLLQFSGLSLRMTNALDNSCKGSHAELVSASLAGAFGQRFRNKFGMTINHNKLRYPEQSEGTEGVSLDNGLTTHPSLPPEGKENSCCHAEFISASLPERIRKFPSPREEGVGERVQLREKINPSPQSSPQGEDAVGRVQGAIREKCAFTLAEVLITLGIIGVVAAMTIPTLMANVKARQYSAKFKKTVSTLSNAAKMSQAQYGFDYSGLTDKCNAKSGTDNPEDKQSLCSLLNGTLTGATYYYGMNNFPNYEIKESEEFNKVDSYINYKNQIPIYQLSDGSLILFSSFLGGNHSKIASSCTRSIGGNPGVNADGDYKGYGTGCYALIDVNGVSRPNKEVKCTRGTNTRSSMEAGNCIVEPKDMGDIFPVVIYDCSVSPYSAAAAYAFSNAK